jgi:hypothetical protein
MPAAFIAPYKTTRDRGRVEIATGGMRKYESVVR